jgi:hypothetical protein
MKTAVKLFKVEGEYDGRPTSGFIYAANENDAEGLFVMEWTWGTHDDIPISIEARFVTNAQREKAAWWQKLEPETYKPKRGRALA